MWIGIKSTTMVLESIDRAANARWSTVENMGVNHRRFDVAMAQKLLNRSNIIPAFEQVSCEGMPESMACGPPLQSCVCDGISHGFLHQRFIYVMSPFLAGFRVLPAVFLRIG